MSNQAAISRRSTLLAATTLVTATALPAVTSIAQTQREEKCDCTPSLPDQAGASGAYSNSAIAMMPPGKAVPTSGQEQVLGVKIARAMLSGPREITKDATVEKWVQTAISSSFAKAPTAGSAFPEMRMRSAMFLCALIPWACNG
jgi:hypothetical protein